MSAQASIGAAEHVLEPPSPLTDLSDLAQTERTRARVIEDLVADGVDTNRAGRVAEASIRQVKARQRREVFRYTDVEDQFEALCRSTGAGSARVEQAKQRIWATAMGISDRRGCSIEVALFFCYHEGLYQHRGILASVGTAATITGVAPH
jgi:hypothetical protein